MITVTLEIPDPKFAINDEIVIVADWRRNGGRGIVTNLCYDDVRIQFFEGEYKQVGSASWVYQVKLLNGETDYFGDNQIKKV